jgi:ethanolamine utilization protein EutA
VLPLRDLPVVPIRLDTLPFEAEGVRETILQALRRHDLQGGAVRALALSCAVEPAYGSLRGLAQGIAAAVRQAGWDREPLVLVFERDIGGLVGALLVEELGYPGPVVSIDEVEVGEFDYLHIGRKLTDAEAVPVVVKSLVFHPPPAV